MSDARWPQRLEPVHGPFPPDKVQGAVAGMGGRAPATAALVEKGWLPPDLMTGFTLLLLAGQPRKPRSEPRERAGAPGVAGRVWVRERVTYHRPVSHHEPFVVTGEGTGRHVRKGRRYATTRSETRDAEGNRLATNLTTGLLGYRPDPALPDGVEGLPLEETPTPRPDPEVAAESPCLAALTDAEVGQVLTAEASTVTLEMMRARDGARAENPIHTDPEIARAAGLARPIAGGSHVQAFALEPVLAAFGGEVLLHGACVDCRWKAPVEAGVAIAPRAEVVAATPGLVELALEVRLESGAVAMQGSARIPRPA